MVLLYCAFLLYAIASGVPCHGEFVLKLRKGIMDSWNKYEPIGCFRSTSMLPWLYLNLRSSINWNRMDLVVKGCSVGARENGLGFFGIKYYGECYGEQNTNLVVQDLQTSDQCVQGVGMDYTMFIYQVVPRTPTWHWLSWSAWSACSATGTETGTRSRMRTCEPTGTCRNTHVQKNMCT